MSISTNNFICDKAQRALAAWIVSQAPSGIPVSQIYKGLENSLAVNDEDENATKALPCVECVCTSATPVEQDNDGITWFADASVRVRSSADDTSEDGHHELAQAVLDVITTDTIAGDLDASLTAFSVMGVTFRTQTWGIDGRTWWTDIQLQILCCGSDIT